MGLTGATGHQISPKSRHRRQDTQRTRGAQHKPASVPGQVTLLQNQGVRRAGPSQQCWDNDTTQEQASPQRDASSLDCRQRALRIGRTTRVGTRRHEPQRKASGSLTILKRGVSDQRRLHQRVSEVARHRAGQDF